MSYVFDVQARAWSRLRKAAGDRIDDWPAHLFEMLIESVHSANHRLDDQINRDPEAGRAARELEEWLDSEEESS